MDETATAAPATEPTLTETLLKRLSDAATPLTLKELANGLKKPSKVKATEFEASLPQYLVDGLRTGRVYRYASGKGGADRYWARDEKHAVREAALAAASTPAAVADLAKKAGAETKTDKDFSETVVRELVGEDKLFEHPPRKKGGQPLFGTEQAPPPPPPKNDPERVRAALLQAAETPRTLAKLIDAAVAATGADKKFVKAEADELVAGEQLYKHGTTAKAPYGREKPKPKHPLDEGKGRKDFDKLLASAKKLLDSLSGVTAADLLQRLEENLRTETVAAGSDSYTLTPSASRLISDEVIPSATADPAEHIETLVCSALEHAGPGSVLEVAEVRRAMPEASRGRVFDEVVLRLANAGRVRLYADDDPLRLSPEERSQCIEGGNGRVFKTMARRG